jgi:hypothetical protein
LTSDAAHRKTTGAPCGPFRPYKKYSPAVLILFDPTFLVAGLIFEPEDGVGNFLRIVYKLLPVLISYFILTAVRTSN